MEGLGILQYDHDTDLLGLGMVLPTVVFAA